MDVAQSSPHHNSEVGEPERTTSLYAAVMAVKRNMITIAVDAATKERVRHYAETAGVDMTTYISAAISAAMHRDDQVARTFAPLDAMIAESEQPSTARPESPPDEQEVTRAESESIDRALDDFFEAPHGYRGVA